MTSTLTVPLSATAKPQELDFDALYRASRDDVYAYVATLLRDRSAAEDVTAQAFERAFRRRRSFDARRGSPRPWIFGIARNAALDELRKRKRSAALEFDPPAPGDGDESERVAARTTVLAALGTLAVREREVIALKYHADLDNSELAAVLGVSVSNAGTLLHRAMTKLRKAIDD